MSVPGYAGLALGGHVSLEAVVPAAAGVPAGQATEPAGRANTCGRIAPREIHTLGSQPVEVFLYTALR